MAHLPPTPPDEATRLARLQQLLVLDTEPEPLFDTLARLASDACGTPVALLTLVDAQRQWFKASVGLAGVSQTPRDVAFCAHAIAGSGLLQVTDARSDPRFADNPLVTGDPHIGFYAGAPLVLADGARVGTLCVIDRQPRTLTDAQAATLVQLAALATQALDMRASLLQRALDARSRHEQALAERESLLRRTGRLAGVGGWELDLRTEVLRWSGQTREIHEVGPDFVPTLQSAIAFYAPEARAEIAAAVRRATEDGTPWNLELPLVTATGRALWVRAVGECERDADGRPLRLVGAFQDITERRQLRQQLAASLLQVQDLYDRAPCGYCSLDDQGRFLQINELALQWMGVSREEALAGLRPSDFYTDAGRRDFQRLFPRFVAEGRFGPHEFELCSRDGSRRWVSVSAVAVVDAQGRFASSRSVMHDVTEVHAAREQLQRLNREQHAMLDNDVVGIVRLRERRMVWHNRALRLMFGYPEHELHDQPTRLLYPDDDSHRQVGEAAAAAMAAGEHYRGQVQLRHHDGRLVWVDLNGMLLSADSGESVWVLNDITPMKQHQAQVEHIAFHDPLTGLPNRLLLADRLQGAVALDKRLQRSMAVCMLDLDGFKAVNDAHGHEAGDRLLREVAARLQRVVRAADTVARLGGDEFVLLLTPLAHGDECGAVLRRVIDAVAEPVNLGAGRLAQVSASIGVAWFPQHGQRGAQLLKLADQAMYEAKRLGKNRFAVHSGAPPKDPAP